MLSHSADITLKPLPQGMKTARLLLEFFRAQPRKYYQAWGYGEPTPKSVNELLNASPVYGIFLNDQELVGIIGVVYKGKYFIQKYSGQYWIHYMVDHRHSGRGIASIAIAKYLEILKNSPLTRIYAGIYSTNPAAIHLTQKMGFKKLEERAETEVFEKRLR